ncbi:isoprenyl transferase [Xylocopilactobacillus apicola]|uniref:Isoprenyl transferase n=1 Tax=Xylocopilactobacillus apicola TaxID=2932184 RepID=A0AAU9DA55_9LACO|nr:isoprenyl transferase [Xylocopilactobacillus apicola]BDR58390.1 isoprenyl transferase [Xylocopilactobacillus apicola]
MNKIEQTNIPAHVAIIMDGNGRWAKKRHLPRIAGHKEGMENVRRITIEANDLGIKVLTLYSFSTENWNRPSDEVSFLMKLPVLFFNKYVPELIERNVKVKITGFTDQIPSATLKVLHQAVEETKNNTGLILNFAFNYGGKAELVNAAQQIARQVKNGLVEPEDIDENYFEKHLLTKLGDLDDVDLLIRTSGEQRISNFLLWQLAYSELYFTDTYWPDFSANDLLKATKVYEQRNRRFGAL